MLKRFSYEEVPLNSLEPTLGPLFRLDPVQPVHLDHHDDLISETNSQPEPNMYMRRATRSIAQRLLGIHSKTLFLFCQSGLTLLLLIIL